MDMAFLVQIRKSNKCESPLSHFLLQGDPQLHVSPSPTEGLYYMLPLHVALPNPWVGEEKILDKKFERTPLTFSIYICLAVRNTLF